MGKKDVNVERVGGTYLYCLDWDCEITIAGLMRFSR